MHHRATVRATRGVAAALVVGTSLGLSSLWRGIGSQGPQDPLADPFVGVTTDGTVIPELFPIRATGVSTAPVGEAADRFLASLTDAQRARTAFPVDDIEWRKWNNVHRYERQGVSFTEMTEAQRERAFALLQAGLSAKGLAKSRAVMRLNGHLGELIGNFEEYGEGLYWLTLMGEPSVTEPWGWQLDGHHLVINYFVLGDQVVMSPSFMGSEPVTAQSGRYAGTTVLQEEQDKGLALATSLSAEQRRTAVLAQPKTRGNALAQAFRDNLVLDYAGIRATALTAPQRELLLDVVAEYVGNLADEHARVKLEDVRAHLDDTYFAWIGDIGPAAVFYYRVHSPILLIEFDHQGPIALPGDRTVPTRAHVHSVV
ncbi:MAG: DUF3500 domain-containing protein, partial [Gemmatimonadota bacterium]|nr:DUF3500 domain-containing protein [Gemmatimonadota bacterium]